MNEFAPAAWSCECSAIVNGKGAIANSPKRSRGRCGYVAVGRRVKKKVG